MKHAKNHSRIRAALPWLTLLWFPFSLLWQELVVKLACFGRLWDRGLLYTSLFTFALGFFLSLLCSLFPPRRRWAAAMAVSGLFTLWYMVQTVYYAIFKTFLVLYSLSGTGQAMQFWRDILSGIRSAAFPLLALLVPVVLLGVFGRRAARLFPARKKAAALTGSLTAAFHVIALAAVGLSTRGVITPRYLYFDSFVPNLSVSNFGVMATLRLDARQLFLPQARAVVQPEETPGSSAPATTSPESTAPSGTEENVPPEQPPVYGDNVMDIDFAALAAGADDPALSAMHRYFGSRAPTRKNAYTGMFQGKNLILITAEGFSRWAVDKELTPTLYRLADSGFVFENFYNPLWWVSTLDGEYVACTSLIPTPGVWSLYRSGDNNMFFCLGNQFRRQGYSTRAYHNHTWNYYSRDVSHPNMGYDYKGLGHGLEVTPTWPESDLEMMEVTVPEFVGDAPFHTYYMTVSGHMNYTFTGNSMAAKHKDEVAHLDMGENARAYLACQMELDRALESLIGQLDKAGQLENTVIALSADHYPYGLEQSALNELNGGREVDMRFDVYRSAFLLWSGDMEEPVVVDKPCSSLDILPTLSNLFGLEYDSRLLMGRDILSDSRALVVLSDHSFITDLGRYDAQADVFTPNEGVSVPDGYAADQARQVNDMFAYSKQVLEQDYYGVLFGGR
ncbi:MAG TPA: LTA synthase family protein [Firmicutes bacterium]|nr:LTA synthase family protein [Bacillota bacterium]